MSSLMRLEIDLSRLMDAVRRMGAESVKVGDVVGINNPPLDPINIELGDGIEVHLSNIDVHEDTGLLTYKKHQILLYIQDHGKNFQNAYEDRREGNKFHVAQCRTLDEMKSFGRYERYVITNDLSGNFNITGQDYTGKYLEGNTKLDVCKNCLYKLNYKNYRNNRRRIFSEFDLNEFFGYYRTYFSDLPKRHAGQFDGGYTKDWQEVAENYKKSKQFICEECHVNLADHKHLLHVHHKDGVKINNDEPNLMVLCADCHKRQPHHGHMNISDEGHDIIRTCRRKQGLYDV